MGRNERKRENEEEIFKWERKESSILLVKNDDKFCDMCHKVRDEIEMILCSHTVLKERGHD